MAQKRRKFFWHNLFYNTAYFVISSPIPEVLFVVALVMSRRQPGAYFNYTSQIWLPIVLLGFLACLAYGAYRVVFGRGSTSHLAALLFSYGLYGYYTVNSPLHHSLFPNITTGTNNFSALITVGIIIALVVVAGAVSWLIRILIARFTLMKNLQAYKVLFVVVSLFFLFEIIRFGNRYLNLH